MVAKMAHLTSANTVYVLSAQLGVRLDPSSSSHLV